MLSWNHGLNSSLQLFSQVLDPYDPNYVNLWDYPMDSTLIILGLNNELNLDDFQGYLQGPTRNLTGHETPRAKLRPRVHGGQWPRVHRVSRELTANPVHTGRQEARAHGVSREISWTP